MSAALVFTAPQRSAAAETLTIAQGNDILSLDPANHGNNSTESALVNIYDYLINKDFSQGQLRFTPRLALSWSTDDNVHWTFKLRDDVYWHNGDKFTAQDVKFTIERSQQDRKLINSGKFRRIKSVEARDDDTLQIETDGPDTLLLHTFVGNGAGILPKAAFEKAGGKEEFFKQPVGTGPYVFQKWIKSDRVVLAKNPHWWGGTPKWDSVVIRSIPETTTRVVELLTGGVDIAVNVPPEDIPRLSDNKGTRAITFDIARNLAGPEPGAQGKAGGLEPLTLLSALAVATSNIGLVGTISTSFSEPYNVARQLASLDHISHGRAGWNVVTTQSDRAAENFSLAALPDHAARYARAGEFVQVVRGLWDSWADDALVMDRQSGTFLDTRRVRLLGHKGEHFSVRGPLNISRPPQGHPVIVQAGSSRDGIGLAAAEADLAFTAQDTIEDSLAYREALTEAARAAGRKAPNLPILPGVMPIVGRTDAEAREKFAALQEHTDIAAGIRQLSGRWGYDLSVHPLDGPVPEPGERIHGESRVRLLLNKARAENYTLRELAALAIASHGHRIIIGSPATVADDLQFWFEQGAADGFNLIPASMPDGLDDFVDLVVPVLQERGLFRRRYEETTLRERFGLDIPRVAAFRS